MEGQNTCLLAFHPGAFTLRGEGAFGCKTMEWKRKGFGENGWDGYETKGWFLEHSPGMSAEGPCGW